MKYKNPRWKIHGEDVLFDMMLWETDVNGLAVYSQVLTGEFEGKVCYRLFKPSDMIEVDEVEESQE